MILLTAPVKMISC